MTDASGKVLFQAPEGIPLPTESLRSNGPKNGRGNSE
jgi:hypothetical protein